MNEYDNTDKLSLKNKMVTFQMPLVATCLVVGPNTLDLVPFWFWTYRWTIWWHLPKSLQWIRCFSFAFGLVRKFFSKMYRRYSMYGQISSVVDFGSDNPKVPIRVNNIGSKTAATPVLRSIFNTFLLYHAIVRIFTPIKLNIFEYTFHYFGHFHNMTFTMLIKRFW